MRRATIGYSGGRALVDVVVVSSQGCHYCEDARSALDELAQEFPLSVKEIDVRSPEGVAILTAHRPLMQPAVLVNGRLFSAGRLPRRKLRRFLEQGAA